MHVLLGRRSGARPHVAGAGRSTRGRARDPRRTVGPRTRAAHPARRRAEPPRARLDRRGVPPRAPALGPRAARHAVEPHGLLPGARRRRAPPRNRGRLFHRPALRRAARRRRRRRVPALARQLGAPDRRGACRRRHLRRDPRGPAPRPPALPDRRVAGVDRRAPLRPPGEPGLPAGARHGLPSATRRSARSCSSCGAPGRTRDARST